MKANSEFDATRGGYLLRSYSNAYGEGTDFYDADEPNHYIGRVNGYSPSEIEEMSEDEFQEILEDNYIN